jgi:hypothetical protein
MLSIECAELLKIPVIILECQGKNALTSKADDERNPGVPGSARYSRRKVLCLGVITDGITRISERMELSPISYVIGRSYVRG